MIKFMKAQKEIEKAVVSGYRAIENGIVSGYKKIEDGFVEAFLRDDSHLKNEDEKRSNDNE